MKPYKLIGTILIIATLLPLAACAPKATATPTSTPEPAVATEAPTETFEPFPTSEPTEEMTATPEATSEAGTPAAPDQGSGTGSEATPTTAPAAPAGGGASGTAADKYQYISQTLPDGYQIRPNISVTIAWTVKNIGTTAWDTNYSLRYFAGPKVKNTYIAFPKTVSANATVALSVTFTTPAEPGDYDLWYKLTNAQSQNFGDVDFKFTVTNTPKNTGGGSGAASTATATSEP